MSKAQIQIQFNWLYVLIAGSIILLVFFGFAMRQRSISQERIAGTVLNDIESIAASASVTKGVAHKINFIMPVRFSCIDCACEFSVKSISKEFEDKIIFAPSEVEGETVLYSVDWKAPYRVTNFLFITDKQYYFVYTNNQISKKFKSLLEKHIPKEIKHKFVTTQEAKSIKKDGKNRIVLLKANINIDDAISLEGGNEEKAVIKFFQNGRVKTVTTIGLAPLLAAIFAEDYEMYDCNMQNALTRMNLVNKVYWNRTNQFNNLVELKLQECSYEDSLDNFEKIDSLTFNPDMDALFAEIKYLENKNNKKIKESCPRIF